MYKYINKCLSFSIQVKCRMYVFKGKEDLLNLSITVTVFLYFKFFKTFCLSAEILPEWN